MVAQDPSRPTVKINAATASWALWRVDQDVGSNEDHGLQHLHERVVEVDIAPPQAEELAPAQPG
jgi:hypothetical protein